MRWMRYRIKTKTEAEDIIVSTLYDIGLEGAQIEDKIPLTPLEKEQMFVDILPETEKDDGVAFLNFFVELEENGKVTVDGEEIEAEELKERIQSELDELKEFNLDIGEGSIELESTEDIDWINNWKKYFHSFYIDDILVIPSWENVPEKDKDKMILHIDPGTAFGTGMHETTQLCIRQLRKFINSETQILDVGTGSGILGILSLMMGAKHVVGTDLDPCAVPAVDDNLKNNNVDTEKFDLIIGNIITEKDIQDKVGYEKYDIVVANILADVLVPLTPVIVDQMKKGAIYITSGILNDNDKEFKVKDACTLAGLEIVETTYQGEWCSVTARKPER
ncbi:MAG: 50S ribosomal protein L11 methyltransferase [Lachnospiraceae bacterium]|nr:50S ribosomal protein L11 methyltransferase [Lachnospiraceae bacterium]